MHFVPQNWLVFTLTALVFWGITGVTQKLSTNRVSSRLSFVWFTLAMLAISAMLALTVPIAWHVKWAVFFLAVGGGALNGLGVLTSFRALESGGKASIVISLVSLYPLLSVGFAVAFLGEHLDPRQAAGIALAITAAILLSLEPAPASK
jgi:bacterial/archaeal transporter family protein